MPTATFDIRQKPFTSAGELDERAAEHYRERLVAAFEESPEGLGAPAGGLASIVVDLGLQYPGVNVADMTVCEFEEVLFRIIPRKICLEPDEAEAIVGELRAFWDFVGRAFGLRHAAGCRRLLEGGAVERLRRALADPRNFGMGKSFVMQGKAMGYDMTSQQGIDAWMRAYNSGLASCELASLPGPADDLRLVDAGCVSGGGDRAPRSSSDARRRRRKLARASRRRNR